MKPADLPPQCSVAGPPLVTVIIPSRHRLELLRRALASVDAQSYPNVEVVVIDNFSDVPIRHGELDVRHPLRIHRTTAIQSLSCNRNAGADMARGELVCFLDDDDLYLPDRIADQAAFLTARADHDFCYGDTLHIDEKGRVLTRASGAPDVMTCLRWRHIHTNTLMVRKRVFETHRFDESMTTYEDVDFTVRLLLGFKGHHIAAVHSVWNRDNRPDQLTQRNYRRAYENWKRLCHRFSTFIESERGLALFYHRKMLLLSARYGDASQCMRSLGVLVRYPMIPRRHGASTRDQSNGLADRGGCRPDVGPDGRQTGDERRHGQWQQPDEARGAGEGNRTLV